MSEIKSSKIECLIGSTIENIKGLEKHSEELTIKTDVGDIKFYHEQHSYESVLIEDFEIDDDLIGSKVLDAEEVASPYYYLGVESGLWTFYKIETNKGGLFVRWLGESNGNYSEGVEYLFTEKNND